MSVPRGYRGIILALVGWLILVGAESPQPGGASSDRERDRTQQEISQSLKRLAGAVEKTNEPKREKADCSESSEDRQSDLCAQWKAANAADVAAAAAENTVIIGWVGVALGVVTMASAIAAAVFACSAAKSAKSVARPWVDIQVHLDSDFPFQWNRRGCTISLCIKFENKGEIPASKSPLLIEVVPHHCLVNEAIRSIESKIKKMDDFSSDIFFPNQEIPVEKRTVSFIPAYEGFDGNSIMPSIIVAASYISPVWRKQFTTIKVVQVRMSGTEGRRHIKRIECPINPEKMVVENPIKYVGRIT